MIKLRKLSFIFVLIIILAINHLLARDTIQSASEYDYPPLAQVTDGEADGFSVDLLKAALDAVEMDVTFNVGPWSEIKMDLAEGRIDVLPLVGRTEERELLYDFTVPYLTLYGAIFVNEGNTSIKTIEDLEDKKIVVMKGDNAEEFVRREQLSKYITTTNTFEEAFQLVSDGKYDAVIANELVGAQLLEATNINNVFLVSQINNFKQDWTFAVTEGDSELLTLLNDGLSRIIIDGTYEVIYKKWFGDIEIEAKPIIELTQKEKAWLDENPVIKIGIFQNEPVIYLDGFGEPQGLYTDIINEIARLEGWDIEFISDTWAKSLERLEAGELDLMTCIAYTEDRDKVMNYSIENVFTMRGQVYTAPELEVDDITDLEGLNITILKDGINGFNFINLCEQSNIDCNIVTVGSYTEIFGLIESGETDAGVVNNIHGSILERDFNVKRSSITFNPFSLLFAAPEGMNEEILTIIDEYLAEWKSDKNSIYYKSLDKWLGEVEKKRIEPELTLKEKAFIESHPIITLGIDGSWAPYIYENQDDSLKGLNADYINLINKYMGTNIQQEVGPWVDIVKKAKNRTIDGLSVSGPIKEREPFFNFSDIYVSEFILLLAPAGDMYKIYSAADLAGKTIAMQKGNEYYSTFLQTIDNVKIVYTDTEMASIKYMLEGKVDYCISSISTFAVLRENYLNLVKVSYVVTEKPLDVVFSIRKDWPELVSIINKGLNSIPESKKTEIHNKWFGIVLKPEKKESKIDLTPEEKTFEERVIELTALGIAEEIDDYLEKNPQKTIEELQNDEYFKAMATQQVGETGYSFVIDSQSGDFYFHPREEFVGTNLAEFKEEFNGLWKILEASRGEQCTPSSGYYGWRELEGEVTRKYLHTACIKNATADGKNLFVVASTYLTEIEGLKYLKKYNVIKIRFAEESIKQKAEDVAKQVEIYLKLNPDMTLKELQEDAYFRDIAIQRVGETGYTAILNYETLFNLFHIEPQFQGMDLSTLKESLPDMWDILVEANKGYDSGGLYDWIEQDGRTKKKYMYTSIVKIRTADDIGMVVAATSYLDEYETNETKIEENGSSSRNLIFWFLGILTLVLIILLILNRLNVIKLENNVIMMFFIIVLLLIVGLFILNAFYITKNLEKNAIENYFTTLDVAAASKHKNIENHIDHLKSFFQIINTRKTLSNEDLRRIVNIGEDFFEIFILDSNGNITLSSNAAHIGLSRATDYYFLNAEEEGYLKPLYLSDTIKKASYTFSYPYKGGVLVARMNIGHIQEIISINEGLGKTGESLLAYRDENGDAVFFTERRFITDLKSRDLIPKEEVDIPITQALLKNEKKFLNYVDYRGVPVFAVTKYIQELDVGLVVKVDKEEALESVLENTTQIWFTTSGIILAVIVIGVIFYFLFTSALRKEVINKTIDLENASKGLKEKVILLQKSEKALRESEEQSRSVTQTAVDAIVSINSAGIVLSWNKAAETIFGYSAAEMINSDLKAILPRQYADRHIAGVKRLKEGGEGRILGSTIEITALRKDGEEFPVELSLSSWNTTDKKYFTGIIRDITERKRNEKEIEHKSKELEKHLETSEEQRVANLVILNDLNKTTKKLSLEMKEREKAEAQVKRDLLEKNTLLQELYHRTKNNMQVISSMLRIEARRSGNELLQTSFKEITSKINTMALVHQKLYQAKDLSRINLSEYILDLVNLVLRGYSRDSKKISFQYEMDDIYVLIDTVMPLGLVINELLSNAFKHAFSNNIDGEIAITLKLDSQGVINLTLADNGIGIPEDMDLRESQSMGLQTMFALVEHQLQGKVEYENGRGLSWHIKLKDSLNSKRV